MTGIVSPLNTMRTRRRDADVGVADAADEPPRGLARPQRHVLEAARLDALRDRVLGDAVADQNLAQIVAIAQPLDRVHQRLHAVHEPMRAGIQHRERRAARRSATVRA